MRALALALLVTACGPSVLWQGRSPDRGTSLRVVEANGRQQLEIDGGRGRTYDAIAIDRLAWTPDGPLVPAQRGADWWMVHGVIEHGPFVAIGPTAVAGERAVYLAQRRDGWRVLDGAIAGPPFDAIGEVLLDPETGVAAYAGRRRGAEHVVWRDRVGPPCTSVALLRMGAKGARIAYVDRAARDVLYVDHAPAGDHDEVLELAVARDEPRWAALVAESACALVHDGERSYEAPILTHLRISADGAHAACLAPAEDGSAIAVVLDGAVVATHRRVEGEALAFVPRTGELVYVAEDAQGPQVVRGGRASERYEEIEGPVIAESRAGWVGRRLGRSEIVIEGTTVATEPWAGQLRLADDGEGYAYVARDGADRFVVTSHGRWPVRRFFVDTLTIDRRADHWAALVPDADARRLDVWLDGVPVATLDEQDLGSGSLDAPPVATIRARLAAILARAAR